MFKKAHKELIIAILLALFLFIFLIARTSLQSPKEEKTIIFLMDGLRWDFVLDNLDELPNFRYIVDNGVYGKLKPLSPTFSVASIAGFLSGKKSDEFDYNYAFIFNTSKEWDCSSSFIGELPIPSSETDLFKIMSENKKVNKLYFLTKAPNDFDPKLVSESILSNDVIYIYDQDPDFHGHKIDLKNETNIIPLMKIQDEKLGAVLAELKKMGSLEKSNIVVLGDHGMGAISKFPNWATILIDLQAIGVNSNNTCYWNDAGVSIRFWFRNQSVESELKPMIIDYFKNKECFFVPDEEYLSNHNVIIKDPNKNRASLGDLVIGLNVGCKVIYEDVPEHLLGFEEKLEAVNAYSSMHGYLDNEHEEMQAFVGISGPLFKEDFYIEMEIIDIAPTLLCGLGYKNDQYYTSIDGKIRCDVLEECQC